MLQISFLEFLVRGIPEGLIFFLAVYVFSKNTIKVKRYLLSSILYSLMVYLIKFLPIQSGEYLILNLGGFITLIVIINNINVIKAVKLSIIIMLLEFICEGANLIFIQFILNKDVDAIFKDSILRPLYLSPSLLFFSCIIGVYYIRLIKRKELKCI